MLLLLLLTFYKLNSECYILNNLSPGVKLTLVQYCFLKQHVVLWYKR